MGYGSGIVTAVARVPSLAPGTSACHGCGKKKKKKEKKEKLNLRLRHVIIFPANLVFKFFKKVVLGRADLGDSQYGVVWGQKCLWVQTQFNMPRHSLLLAFSDFSFFIKTNLGLRP